MHAFEVGVCNVRLFGNLGEETGAGVENPNLIIDQFSII